MKSGHPVFRRLPEVTGAQAVRPMMRCCGLDLRVRVGHPETGREAAHAATQHLEDFSGAKGKPSAKARCKAYAAVMSF